MKKAKRTTKVREVQVTGSLATPPHVATWESELFVRAVLAKQNEDHEFVIGEQEVGVETR